MFHHLSRGAELTMAIDTTTASTPRLLQVGFSSQDLERTTAFFVTYLGFRPGQCIELSSGPYRQLIGLPESRLRLQRLHLGEECLEITQVLDPGPGQRPSRPIPTGSRSCDLWFQHICLVTSDLDWAIAELQPALDAGLATAVSTAPQTLPEWNRAAAGIRAFKFRDPEGHNLELLQFPADKGDARWHPTAADDRGKLLGIDHSAISVANTTASCRFYDELLQLKLGGDGVNSGPTQDGLDGLLQTEVRITAHRCPQGAGLECLNYLPPNQGLPIPADLAMQDRAHWQIRLQVDNLEAIASQIETFKGRLLSPGIVELGPQADLFHAQRALQVADPDGHRLQLVEA